MKIIDKIRYKIFEKLEPLLFSPFFIKNIDTSRNQPNSRLISVAIPHYKRGKKIHLTLKNIFKDKRINEIVILDDGSSLEEFNYLVENISRFQGKIKLFRREQNIGAFGTKIQAVSLCSNEWVILLDSDNSIFRKYIDTIFNLQTWDERTIYCASFAYPYLDFRSLSREVIDFQKCSNILNDKINNIDRKIFEIFINDGNYFLNKNNFLQALLDYKNSRVFAADVIFANYIWLSQGHKLEVLENASYFHRVHNGSTWLNSMRESIKSADIIQDMFKKGIRADREVLSDLIDALPYAWTEPTAVPLEI